MRRWRRSTTRGFRRARGGGCDLGRLLRSLALGSGSRSAMGRPSHRGQASRAEDWAAGRGRGDWRNAVGASWASCNPQCPGSAQSPSQARLERNSADLDAARGDAGSRRGISFAARCARHDEPVCSLGCAAARGRSVCRVGSAGVEVDPGSTELERGTSLLVVARFQGPVPPEANLVVEKRG